MASVHDTLRLGEPRSFETDAMENAIHSSRFRKWRLFLIAFAFAVVVTTPLFAQDTPSQPAGLPEDWTHHHAAFGDAGTAAQAIQNGKYEQWVRTVYDPRYQLQRAKRTAAARAQSAPFNKTISSLTVTRQQATHHRLDRGQEFRARAASENSPGTDEGAHPSSAGWHG